MGRRKAGGGTRPQEEDISGHDQPQSRASRSRKVTEKQGQINKDNEAAVLRKYERLLKENERLKKKVGQSGIRKVQDNEDYDNLSNFSPESEGEDDLPLDLMVAKPVSAFTSKGTIEKPAPKKVLHRLGDPQADIGSHGARARGEPRTPPSRSRTPQPARTPQIRRQDRSPVARGRTNSRTPRTATPHTSAHTPSRVTPASATRHRGHSSPRLHRSSSISELAQQHTSSPRRGISPPRHSSRRSGQDKRGRSPSRSPLPSPAAKRVRVAAFRNGERSHGRPAAKDYESDDEKLILRAGDYYQVRILTENAFPDSLEQLRFAREAWAWACRTSGHNVELTSRITQIIKARGSQARGALKDRIRQVVRDAYGFKRDTSKPQNREMNEERYQWLMKDRRYCYKDIEEMTGYAENIVLMTALQEQCFKSASDLGLEFVRDFNPVTLVTLALLFTAVEYCLLTVKDTPTENSKKAQFTEKEYKVKYESNLKALEDWEEMNPAVTKKIRQRMYGRVCRIAGFAAREDKGEVLGMSETAKNRARAELMSRTGDTASEGEF